MSAVRSGPCTACPYRRDAPSGLWASEEYDKLPPYDEPTFAQPIEPFMCHATPDHYCHGWAVVHTSRGHDRDLLALRFRPPDNDVPDAGVPLFDSGAEAAKHGRRDVERPSVAARATADRLLRKYDRLQREAP